MAEWPLVLGGFVLVVRVNMMGVWLLLGEDKADTIEEPTVPVPPATATRILVGVGFGDRE